MPTFYEVLGIDPESTQDEVKKAFRRAASETHPDRGGDAQKFKAINEAYQTLGDPDKRAVYDLNNNIRGMRSHGAPPPNPFGPNFDFFWNSATRNYGQPKRNENSSPPPTTGRGDDIYVSLDVSLEESLRGCKKQVTARGVNLSENCKQCKGTGGNPGAPFVSCGSCAGHGKSVSYGSGMKVRPCGSCHGRGQVSVSPCRPCRGIGRAPFSRELQIQIPSGVTSGDRLRVSGQGCPGQPPGDLFVEVKVEPDNKFRREGVNLHADLPITLEQAILGGTQTMTGPDGQVMSVSLKPGTQPGDVITIPGRGVVSQMGSRQGSLNIHLKVTLPKKLTPRAVKLLEELMNEVGRST